MQFRWGESPREGGLGAPNPVLWEAAARRQPRPQMNDDLFQALTSHDLKVPQPLVTLKAGDQVLKGSNLGNDAVPTRHVAQLYVAKLANNKNRPVSF